MDFGRPIEIGDTMPGNRTRLRTGTMISASGGSSFMPGIAVSPLDRLKISASDMDASRLLQCDQQASVDNRTPHAAVTSRRQATTALEPALRQCHAKGRPRS